MNDRSKRSAYISKKIIALRNSAGWSQSELARQAGITSAAISQIEKGDRLPSLIVCQKLAEAFNVSVAELTGDVLLSSAEINDEAHVFFRKFGDINNLTKADQEILHIIINRLKQKHIERKK
ncbi:MAG TPA: helix-turn-helix transcriptional regulator [Gammaproteobacteria bacterium]|nr:helix-turn-helix transcriptional regulator [Gammaproteobacteria bacterium]